MPVPVIQFTKNMTSYERLQSLHKIRGWCESAEAIDSKAKVTVLQYMLNYAFKHLAVTSSLSFMSADQADDVDCQLCDAIFRHADLPELLFMQYLINQINLIQPESRPMRDGILPIAQKCKDTLMIPVLHETRNIGIATFAFSFLMRFPVGLLLSAIAFLGSEYIANWRIARSLENKLALKEVGGKVPRVEDGYDDVLNGVSTFSNKTYRAVTSFFKVLPAMMSETKETPRPSVK